MLFGVKHKTQTQKKGSKFMIFGVKSDEYPVSCFQCGQKGWFLFSIFLAGPIYMFLGFWSADYCLWYFLLFQLISTGTLLTRSNYNVIFEANDHFSLHSAHNVTFCCNDLCGRMWHYCKAEGFMRPSEKFAPPFVAERAQCRAHLCKCCSKSGEGRKSQFGNTFDN